MRLEPDLISSEADYIDQQLVSCGQAIPGPTKLRHDADGPMIFRQPFIQTLPDAGAIFTDNQGCCSAHTVAPLRPSPHCRIYFHPFKLTVFASRHVIFFAHKFILQLLLQLAHPADQIALRYRRAQLDHQYQRHPASQQLTDRLAEFPGTPCR